MVSLVTYDLRRRMTRAGYYPYHIMALTTDKCALCNDSVSTIGTAPGLGLSLMAI